MSILLNSTAHSSKDRLIRSMVKMQADHPFFSYILCHFKVEMSEKPLEEMPTAGVDARGNFFYNDEFIKGLSSGSSSEGDEISGLLAHEVMHIAKGDFFRRGQRDPTIWNIASDMVINYILQQEGFTLPKEGIRPNKSGDVTLGGKSYNVANKITEEVYDELIENAVKITIQVKGDGQGQKGQKGSGGGFDIHIEDPNGDMSEAEKKQLAKEWEQKVVEAATSAQARGKLPGCAQSLVEKILNPVIDWRSRVARFITNEIPVDYTNRIPSRKFYGTGVWSPKVLRENLDVFVSIDVSGSTSGDRQYFINEIMGILNSYEQIKARLIFWDYVVKEENDFLVTSQNKHSLLGLKIVDCDGGTRFSSYADYIETKGYKSRLHIVLTDGEIESDPTVPEGVIMFVLTKNGHDSVVKEFGAVTRLSDVEY